MKVIDLKDIIISIKPNIMQDQISEKTNIIEDLLFDSLDVVEYFSMIEEKFDLDIFNGQFDFDNLTNIGQSLIEFNEVNTDENTIE